MSAPDSEVRRFHEDEYIDLLALWRAAWKQRFVIVAATSIVALVTVLIVMLLPNYYRADTLLAPVSQDRPRALSGIAGGLGALAGLAGLNLGGLAVDNTTVAIQLIQSREFLTEFAHRHDVVAPLFAAKKWDLDRQEWVIDLEIYDPVKKLWTRQVEPPAQPQPSDWEIYKAMAAAVKVEQDPKTGLVRVSFESKSPVYAERWLAALVRDVNEEVRRRDAEEARRSIQHLEERLKETNITEMRLAAFQLIEEQMKTVMLAEARPEYVFRVLDPPVAPERKSRPQRALICIAATFAAGLLSTIFAVIYQLGFRERRALSRPSE